VQEDRQPMFGLELQQCMYWLKTLWHLPGHRGHRQRRYPRTRWVVGQGEEWMVMGPMPPYTASILEYWQEHRDQKAAQVAMQQVNRWLTQLGLTSKVQVKAANAAELTLHISRLPTIRRGSAQMVDLADVGFGVSEVLPLLVALAGARPGQMVLVEQPELHLHPKAQLALGSILAEATQNGVIVVAETHSSLLLRAVQTVVAQGKLSPDQVGLNWFSRDTTTGFSTVTQADLQEDGSFGEWPVDFPDVYAMADQAFIDAVFARGET
jgi:predicted ATPase